MDNEQIVNSIKKLCKEHNITITKLEETLNLSQGLISRWNKSDPSLSKIIDIADYFNISIDEVIGRKNFIDDKFIEKLIFKTANNELIWSIYTDDKEMPKQYSDQLILTFRDQDEADFYDETHKQISYYTKVNNGYISIYGMYEYHNIKDPLEIKLFIQPDDKSDLIEQDYSKDQLKPLLLKILFALDEAAPDEIKVEEFKNSFILEEENNYTRHNTKNNNIPSLDDKTLQQIKKTFDNDEIRELQKTISSPQFQESLHLVNKLRDIHLFPEDE